MKKACFWIEDENLELLRKQKAINGSTQGWIVNNAVRDYFNKVDNGGKFFLDIKDAIKQKLRKECINRGITLNVLVNTLIEEGLAE